MSNKIIKLAQAGRIQLEDDLAVVVFEHNQWVYKGKKITALFKALTGQPTGQPLRRRNRWWQGFSLGQNPWIKGSDEQLNWS